MAELSISKFEEHEQTMDRTLQQHESSMSIVEGGKEARDNVK
jgi:hypothetical protein